MTPKGKAKAAFQNLPVVGVFIDPVHMCRLSVPGDTTLDKIGQLLLNQIHKSLGEELPAPLNTQVLLEADLKTVESDQTTLNLLNTRKNKTYFYLFEMPLSPYRANKENVPVVDDGGRPKLPGSSDNPTFHFKPPRPAQNTPIDAPSTSAIDFGLLQQQLLGQLQASNAEFQARLTSEVESKITKLNSRINGLTSSNAELTSSNAELKSTISSLTSKVDELTSSNAKRESRIGELTFSNDKLTFSNASLLAKVSELEACNRDMSSTLQRHSKRIFALDRRIILDDARSKIARVYNYPPDQLWPSRTEVGPLVQDIRSKLNPADAKLLSTDTLTMIFETGDGTVREEGNRAAHEAFLADCANAVMEATLPKWRRVSLQNLYEFVHGQEPTL
jgi:hypothetical protein